MRSHSVAAPTAERKAHRRSMFHRRERAKKVFDGKRFLEQNRARVGQNGAETGMVRTVPGNEDDWQARPEAADGFGEHHTVNVRQREIEQCNIGMTVRDEADRGPTFAKGIDLEAAVAEKPREADSDALIVFDKQNPSGHAGALRPYERRCGRAAFPRVRPAARRALQLERATEAASSCACPSGVCGAQPGEAYVAGLAPSRALPAISWNLHSSLNGRSSSCAGSPRETGTLHRLVSRPEARRLRLRPSEIPTFMQ